MIPVRMLVPILCLAVSAPSVLAAPPAGIRTETRTEQLAYGSKLWVKNRNGAIKVTGWNKEEVELTAEIRDSERRRIEVTVARQGADLEVEARFQQPAFSFFLFGFSSSPKCDMTLNVPRRILAHFRTTNGTVTAGNLDGYTRCETTNGDIVLDNLAGEVMAESTNGAVEAHNLKARIKAETTNGPIDLENVDGGVKAETTNGHIKARNLDGWGEGISLESTNGYLEVELGRAGGDLEAELTNGSIDLRLPGAQLIEVTKRHAHVKVPGKNQKIKLETTNGDIRVH